MRVLLAILLVVAAADAEAGELVVTGARLEPGDGPAVDPAVIVVKVVFSLDL